MSQSGNGCKACGGVTVAGSQYCLFHDLEKSRQRAANRAYNRGDTLEGFLNTGLAWVASAIGQEAQQPRRVAQAKMFWQMQQDARAAQAEAEVAVEEEDPFPILGLDRATATEKDVRRVQRKLASIWHNGDQENVAAQERMKRFNLAADRCIRILQGKDENGD